MNLLALNNATHLQVAPNSRGRSATASSALSVHAIKLAALPGILTRLEVKKRPDQEPLRLGRISSSGTAVGFEGPLPGTGGNLRSGGPGTGSGGRSSKRKERAGPIES
jgi:hypothetical protein